MNEHETSIQVNNNSQIQIVQHELTSSQRSCSKNKLFLKISQY